MHERICCTSLCNRHDCFFAMRLLHEIGFRGIQQCISLNPITGFRLQGKEAVLCNCAVARSRTWMAASPNAVEWPSSGLAALSLAISPLHQVPNKLPLSFMLEFACDKDSELEACATCAMTKTVNHRGMQCLVLNSSVDVGKMPTLHELQCQYHACMLRERQCSSEDRTLCTLRRQTAGAFPKAMSNVLKG